MFLVKSPDPSTSPRVKYIFLTLSTSLFQSLIFVRSLYYRGVAGLYPYHKRIFPLLSPLVLGKNIPSTLMFTPSYSTHTALGALVLEKATNWIHVAFLFFGEPQGFLCLIDHLGRLSSISLTVTFSLLLWLYLLEQLIKPRCFWFLWYSLTGSASLWLVRNIHSLTQPLNRFNFWRIGCFLWCFFAIPGMCTQILIFPITVRGIFQRSFNFNSLSRHLLF